MNLLVICWWMMEILKEDLGWSFWVVTTNLVFSCIHLFHRIELGLMSLSWFFFPNLRANNSLIRINSFLQELKVCVKVKLKTTQRLTFLINCKWSKLKVLIKIHMYFKVLKIRTKIKIFLVWLLLKTNLLFSSLKISQEMISLVISQNQFKIISIIFCFQRLQLKLL